MWEAKKAVLLEMYENPNDLAVVITEDTEIRKFGFWVSRGPELSHKIMLIHFPFSSTTEAVLVVVRLLFERVLSAGSQEHEGHATQDTKFFDVEIMEALLKELQKNRIAQTF